MINAVKVAQEIFEKNGGRFDEALVRCLLKGSVLAYQNEILMLGEPVLWDGEKMDNEVYDKSAWNCWFVHFAYAPGLGMRALLALAPFYLPYVAFCRRGKEMKVYQTERVI